MIFSGLRQARVWASLAFLCFSSGGATNDLNLGQVRVRPAERAITFPAVVNQRTGLVEYLVVHESGKVHESIFRTGVGAQQVHAAALLFSAGTNKATFGNVKGIEVSWGEGESKKKFAAAELILDKDRGRALRETKWIYRGSRVVDGVFLAEREGSLIAIMEDRHALIDQGTPDAANDENWEPIAEKLPAMGTAVVITIRFEETKTK